MDRTKGIGGTDISAIVGLNPWRTPLDVFLEKTGQSIPKEDNENMWWGRELEPVLSKRYTKETGTDLIIPWQEELPAVHPDFPWYVGSPDALKYEHGYICYLPKPILMKAEGGVDFKTSGQPQEWGEAGTDQVPEHYYLQAMWYMGLTTALWWDIAVLIMGFTRDFKIFRINRDQEIIDRLTILGADFWNNHVLPGIPPELDGSESASRYLNQKYPFDKGPMMEPTDEDILRVIYNYSEIRAKKMDWEYREALMENQLKAIIGDCAGMQGKWGKITWKANKNGKRIFRPQFKED